MVFCVAFGCSNGDNSGKSFFSFPSIEKEPSPRRRRQWIKQVGRVNWTPTRTRCSRLCQDYFDSSCFVTDPAVYQTLCFKTSRQRLKKSTLTCPIIPTIFKRIREIETKERRNLPFQKRRNLVLEIRRSDSNTNGGKNNIYIKCWQI